MPPLLMKGETIGGVTYPLPQDLTQASDADLEVMRQQLGRTMRGVVGIAARCVCGRPTVVRTAPRLPDGTPFPTTYYLTHPKASAVASRLEHEGLMREMAALLAQDAGLREAYLQAHVSYIADRQEAGRMAGLEDVPEIAGVSAGGMPTRVKCLHALMGHALARPGVNPLGEQALAKAKSLWSPQVCACVIDPQPAEPRQTETRQA